MFNALLKKQVADAAPYPFCTIEPNVGIVPVPDGRLEKLALLVEKEEGTKPPLVPAIVEFVDIAGLVKGASEGQGLGNKFLAHIREVDLICHVLRFFPDPSVVHVEGDVDATRDREIIETELILADLQTLNKQIEPKGKVDKDMAARWELVKRLQEGLDKGTLAKDIITDPEDQALIVDFHLLTMKPVLYVGNVGEGQVNNPITQLSNTPILPISAKIEAELASLTPEEQKEYLKELGLEASGLDRLIQKAYQMLGLISFLTAGVKEVKAWTIASGMKAPQAAGVIHTDFEKKFIKAEVISYADLVATDGWKKAKEVGKIRMEGREYVMHDGDVVEYKIGA